MPYFKFIIPKQKNGDPVRYSPDWCGETSHVPADVKVLLYNDRDGYGVAVTPDDSIPKEFTILTESEALALVAPFEKHNEWKVFAGDKLDKRWSFVERGTVDFTAIGESIAAELFDGK